MRRGKRILAVVLTLVMVLAMGMNVFAADTGNQGRITVQAGDIDIVGETFFAYRIMDATVSSSGNVAYTISSKFEQFFTGQAKNTNDEAYEYLNTTDTKNVIDAIKDYIDTNKMVEDGKATKSDSLNIAEFPELPFGYYIIIPQGGDKTPNLTTLKSESQDVYIKGVNPTVDKKADEEKWTSAQVGDEITFVVTSSIPDMTGKTQYYFKLEDTMSKGLTLSEITPESEGADTGTFTAEVEIGGVPVQKSDYEATYTKNADGETTITVNFNEFIKHQADAGKTITFTYKAKLNKDAVDITEETNSATVSWSNTPDFKGEGSGKSDPDVVNIYNYDLKITKTDDASPANALSGAQFEIYRKNADGNVDSVPVSMIHDVDDTDPNAVYHIADATETTGTISYVETPANGVVIIKGFDAGTYVLKETKVPDGYNKATDQDVKFNPVDETEAKALAGKPTEITVVNIAGTLLPETGGMGTILFTVIGGVLIIAAAGSLIYSRRKKSDK